jgi:hypothetical protein
MGLNNNTNESFGSYCYCTMHSRVPFRSKFGQDNEAASKSFDISDSSDSFENGH